MIPLILYSDDTSGNRSKKWNKFDLWSLLLAGLPREENTKMENIHIIGASNQVEALEMADPIVDDLLQLEQVGIEVYEDLVCSTATNLQFSAQLSSEWKKQSTFAAFVTSSFHFVVSYSGT